MISLKALNEQQGWGCGSKLRSPALQTKSGEGAGNSTFALVASQNSHIATFL